MGKKIILIVIVVIILSVLLTSCTSADTKQARGVVLTFMQQVKYKNYEAAALHLSDKFYEEYSKEDIFDLFEYINEQFGDMETYSITFMKTLRRYGSNGGYYFEIHLEVRYQTTTTTEQIWAYKAKKNDEIKINSYYIEVPEAIDLSIVPKR